MATRVKKQKVIIFTLQEEHVTPPQNASIGLTNMEKEDVTFSKAAVEKEEISGEDSKVETTYAH